MGSTLFIAADAGTRAAVTPYELQELLAENRSLELLDVRTPGEYAAGHVPGAVLLPVDDLDAAAYLEERGAVDRPIYVICQTSRRSRQAAAKFQRAGFADCIFVEGGTQAWMESGLPVERSVSKTLPLMRQVHITVGLLSALGAVLALTVNPLFAIIPLFIGCGLLFAGLTGVCGMAMVLAKMPWNRLGKSRSVSCCEVGPETLKRG